MTTILDAPTPSSGFARAKTDTLFFNEVELNAAFPGLNTQQKQFCNEFLAWLRDRPNQMQVLCGAAGSGKTFAIKAALTVANYAGLLPGKVYACAPTHQAKGILANSLLGAPVSGISTSHSLLNMRPQTMKFSSEDESSLLELLSIKPKDRIKDQDTLIDWLQTKRIGATEQIQEFITVGELKLHGTRLIVVDEAGMNNKYMHGIFCNLLLGGKSTLHPDFQILFMGDYAQLPPIGEEIGKVFDSPWFSELTEIERYKGAILKYCSQVRHKWPSDDRPASQYQRLHLEIKPDSEDDESLLCLPSYQIFDPKTLKEVYDTGSVRFVAATNARVRELNYLIRHTLKNDCKSSQLFYEPGDVILTMSPVQQAVSGVYGIQCNAKKGELMIGTSTLIELGRQVEPGEIISLTARSSAIMTDTAFEFKSAFGTGFARLVYRYRLADSEDEFDPTRAICLIDPEQFGLWKDECDLLMNRARTTSSKGKTIESSRGQNGDAAQEVWKANGMKNWFKKIDGSSVSDDQYKRIKNKLWIDYFNLAGFADNASYSYASTCHRLQGATVDVIVLDINNILSSGQGWAKSEKKRFDEKRMMLYTAATRASKQLVFLV